MKKLLRIAVILCLAMCLCISALAVFSDYGSGIQPGTEGIGPNGEKIALTVSTPTATPTVAEVASAIETEGVTAEKLDVVWVQDITANIPEGGSVTITFEVPGATAADTVFVLHYNGSAWETVATCKGDDIKAVFTSLSPVALVLEKAASQQPDTTKPEDTTKPADTTTPGGEEPPKTGEGPVLLVAAAVVLVAGAVAVVALKKKKEM